MPVIVERSLLAEIEGAFASGSAKKQVEILRLVTDFFLAGVSGYSGEQVDLFDGVIVRLAEKIETKARAELAIRLATVENAPPAAVRQLARDRAIEVAGPILRQSPRLTDNDLLTFAKDDSQERLLAISQRAALSENISDVLVARGNRDVVLSITRNAGARFSNNGYRKLIDRSVDDDVLAVCVGMRKDISRNHFHMLVSKASEAVFAKLAASNPTAVAEVQKVLTDITGHEVAAKANPDSERDYRDAQELFDTMRRMGRPPDAAVQEFAATGKFLETVVALTALSGAPRDLVKFVISDWRGKDDSALVLAKAAGLSWPTAMKICVLRRGPRGLPPAAIDKVRQSFESLKTETAQRIVRFYNERHNALGNFHRLAEQFHQQDGEPRAVSPQRDIASNATG